MSYAGGTAGYGTVYSLGSQQVLYGTTQNGGAQRGGTAYWVVIKL